MNDTTQSLQNKSKDETKSYLDKFKDRDYQVLGDRYKNQVKASLDYGKLGRTLNVSSGITQEQLMGIMQEIVSNTGYDVEAKINNILDEIAAIKTKQTTLANKDDTAIIRHLEQRLDELVQDIASKSNQANTSNQALNTAIEQARTRQSQLDDKIAQANQGIEEKYREFNSKLESTKERVEELSHEQVIENQKLLTKIKEESSVRTSMLGAMGTKVTSVETATENNTGSIRQLSESLSTTESALSRRIDSLQATTTSEQAKINARIQNHEQVSTSTTNALSQRITELQSSIGNDIDSKVTQKVQTLTNEQQALARQINQLDSAYKNADVQMSARYNQAIDTLTQADRATATKLVGLESKTLESTAKINELQQSITIATESINTVKQTIESGYIPTKDKIADTKSKNEPPRWYLNNHANEVVKELKFEQVLGVTSAQNIAYLQTTVLGDKSGTVNQIVYLSNGRVFQRQSLSLSSWGQWTEQETDEAVRAKITQAVEQAKQDLQRQVEAVNSSFNQYKQTQANKEQALSQRVTALDTAYKQADNTLTARIQREEQARATADTAQSKLIENLTAKTNQATASIEELKRAKVDTTAITSEVSRTVSATLDANITRAINNAKQGITTDIANAIRPVTASIQRVEQAQVTLDGKASAKSELILNTAGKLSGFKINSSASVSDFEIMSDKFKITNGRNTHVPFSISGNDIQFNGKVSFNNVQGVPNIPTEQQITNLARNQLSNISLPKLVTVSSSRVVENAKLQIDERVLNANAGTSGLRITILRMNDLSQANMMTRAYTTTALRQLQQTLSNSSYRGHIAIIQSLGSFTGQQAVQGVQSVIGALGAVFNSTNHNNHFLVNAIGILGENKTHILVNEETNVNQLTDISSSFPWVNGFLSIDTINNAINEDGVRDIVQNTQIDGSKIRTGTVQADRLVAGSITANLLSSNAVETRHIKAGSVDSSHIKAGSIKTEHLQANSITANMLRADSVEARHIRGGTITGAQIAGATINMAHIANGLQSDNYVPNRSGWKLHKDGTIEINSTFGDGTRTQLTSRGLTGWYANGNKAFELGVFE